MKEAICLLMVCAALIPAAPAKALYVKETNTSAEIIPFYVGTFYATTSLSIDTDGNATCSGCVRLVDGYTAMVTMSVQQRISGEWKAQKSWSANGKNDITLSQCYTVSSGYAYQTVLTARVYNPEGIYVETVSTASAVTLY